MSHKAIYRRAGSKVYLAKDIIPLMPAHYAYCEVFGGAGNLLVQKERSRVEIFNDIDKRIYTFFIALRDYPQKLQAYLRLCPVSRELVTSWATQSPADWGVVEKAAQFFMESMISYSGTSGRSFPTRSGYRKDGNTRKVHFAEMIARKVELLDQFAARLRLVVIENLDFRELFRRYDWDKVFFYCDPEYIDYQMYDHGMTQEDHRDLAEIAHKIKGKICLSYYPHPLLDELYPRDSWHYIELTATKQIVKRHRKEKAVELLIMNYDPTKDKFIPDRPTLDSFFGNGD